MNTYSKLDRFERLVNSVSSAVNLVACATIVVMLLITCTDFIGTKLFRWPFPGAFEITGFLGLVVVSFSLAFTQVLKGHTAVDFLVSRLSRRPQAVIASVVYLLGLVLFALMAWQMLNYGRTAQAAGRVTGVVPIPLSPFAYATAACCLLMCLVLLVALLRSVKGAGK